MITHPKEEPLKGKTIEGIATVTGQNLKGEGQLVILKDRPLSRPGESLERTYARVIEEKEEQLWKDNHPNKTLFITVCPKCKARYLLDYDAEKTDFECACEIGSPNKEQSHYYVCNAGHSHFDVKKLFDKAKGCKICQRLLNTQTKQEAQLQQQAREEAAEERRAAEKLRKDIEVGKAKASAKEKKAEAELFAAVLTKQLIPLFEGIPGYRNDRKK